MSTETVGNDIVVTNEQGQRIRPNITCWAPWPAPVGVGPYFEGAVAGAPGDTGWAFWNAPAGPARVLCQLPGYDNADLYLEFPCRLRVAMKKQVATVRPWRRDGLNYIDDTGAIQKVRGVTAFSFLQRFVRGETDALLRFAEKCHAQGVNTARYFTMYQETSLGRTRFAPWDYTPEQMTRANVFMREQMGLRPWMVGFCDQGKDSPIRLTREQQDAHWWNCQQSLPDELECVNEPGRSGGANGGYELSSRLSRPATSAIAFRGCVDDGEDPRAAGSLWDGTTTHPPRGHEQGRKPGKVNYEDEVQGGAGWAGTGMPCRSGEPFQISAATARECADAAASAELMGAGFVIHDAYPSIQDCVWPTGQDAKLEAIRRVWAANMDRSLVGATYDRDNILTGDQMGGAERYYVMHNGQTGVGVVCYADTSSLKANHGWRIAEQTGYEGNIVKLSR